MSLLLAPWTPAMRLGQGFNSFTHELCIDKAVEVKDNAKERNITPAQTVSYTARVVDKLSDVIESMNVSYSASIKKGTVEVSGNTNTIDETTFKSSDLNAVINVKVVNETVSLPDGCRFLDLKGVLPGSSRFNEIYGDCYISGYIEGGDFTSIVSLKVLDTKHKDQVIKKMKGNFSSTASEEEINFETLPAGLTDLTNDLRETAMEKETSISVSWTGGGKIKNENQKWDLDSAMAAAAAFPTNVAKCPQRTWAILTKYKANRSFIEWASDSVYHTLDYDQVSSYTAELFDNYMDYKLLLKTVQSIINNRDKYEARRGVINALDTSVSTLISVRSVLREEQAKIVAAVEALSKDPGILARQANTNYAKRAQVVNDIIRSTLGDAAFVPYRSTSSTVPKPVPTSQISPSSQPQSELSISQEKPSVATDLVDDHPVSEASYGVKSLNDSETGTTLESPKADSSTQTTTSAPADGPPSTDKSDMPSSLAPTDTPSDGPPASATSVPDGPPDGPSDGPPDAPPTQISLPDGPPDGPPSSSPTSTSKISSVSAKETPTKPVATDSSKVSGAKPPMKNQPDPKNKQVITSGDPTLPPAPIPVVKGSDLPANKSEHPAAPSQEIYFNFDALMAPEIWEDLLPTLKPEHLPKPTTSSLNGLAAVGVSSLAAQFPPPPDDYVYPEVRLQADAQEEVNAARAAKLEAENSVALAKANEQIAQEQARAAKAERDALNVDLSSKLAAAETKALNADQDYARASNKCQELEQSIDQLRTKETAAQSRATTAESKFNAVNTELMSANQRVIAAENQLQQTRAELLPRDPNSRVWIAFVCYGGKCYHDHFCNHNSFYVDKFKNLAQQQSYFRISNELLHEDPWYGRMKELVITYRYDGGRLRYLFGWEGSDVKFDSF